VAELAFTMGIEEEYLLVDPKTRDLIQSSPRTLVDRCAARCDGQQVSPELLRDTTEDKPRAVDFITAFAHGKPAHLGHAPTPGNWMMGSGAALIAACSADVLHRDFAVCDAWDGAAAAAEVQCPTLVVAGAADRMTPPRAGKAIADAVTGARYELLPATGHMIPSEAPRQLLRLLQDFLRKVQAAA